ncbi:MAG: hypothetical protein WCG05_05520 [Alphaproteobacteria bacterium]
MGQYMERGNAGPLSDYKAWVITTRMAEEARGQEFLRDPNLYKSYLAGQFVLLTQEGVLNLIGVNTVAEQLEPQSFWDKAGRVFVIGGGIVKGATFVIKSASGVNLALKGSGVLTAEETLGSVLRYSAEKTGLGAKSTGMSKGYHPAYIDNQIKGFKAEQAAIRELQGNGYQILESKLPGNRGIDVVAIKRHPNGDIKDILVVESKYRTSGNVKLPHTKNAGQQMSDGWIDIKIKEMKGAASLKIKDTGDLLHSNQHLIRRKVNVLDGKGVHNWEKGTKKLPLTEKFKE